MRFLPGHNIPNRNGADALHWKGGRKETHGYILVQAHHRKCLNDYNRRRYAEKRAQEAA